jgi:hypothetical protein
MLEENLELEPFLRGCREEIRDSPSGRQTRVMPKLGASRVVKNGPAPWQCGERLYRRPCEMLAVGWIRVLNERRTEEWSDGLLCNYCAHWLLTLSGLLRA